MPFLSSALLLRKILEVFQGHKPHIFFFSVRRRCNVRNLILRALAIWASESQKVLTWIRFYLPKILSRASWPIFCIFLPFFPSTLLKLQRDIFTLWQETLETTALTIRTNVRDCCCSWNFTN